MIRSSTAGNNIFTGNKEYGTENQNYKPLQAGAICTLSSPPTCTAVNISGLEWSIHGHHTYYISIKVTNTAGLVMIQTSSPYIHDVQPPAEGVILDIDTQVSCVIMLYHYSHTFTYLIASSLKNDLWKLLLVIYFSKVTLF
jgi:hypothetical protein